jgi:type I restriction enzyme S subunit
MRSSYKKLGKYITPVDKRNRKLEIDNLIGLSIQKKFIPSISNTIGTDMSTYRILNNEQFAYCPVTSRNGEKITIALYQEEKTAIISQAYDIFEIKDKSELLPEYLMMWFRRPEFDRYARFMSHGSVRELLGWEELCDLELPIPSPDKQREIIKEYNTIINRIELNNQLIQKLEETAQAIYKQWFVDFEFPNENGEPYKSAGGEMEFNKELEVEIPKGWEVKALVKLCDVKGGKRLPKGENLNGDKKGNPYIKVADLHETKFIVLNDNFEYVDDEVQKSISRYIVSKNDVIVSIVGTIGRVNIVHESLDKANLTENCVKLTNFKTINSDYLYHFLSSPIGQRLIETKTVGGVQGKLPLYNIQSIQIVISAPEVLEKYQMISSGINKIQQVKTTENSKLTAIRDLLLSKLATVEN